jgi:F-type H+-transporting ATPase subunit b
MDAMLHALGEIVLKAVPTFLLLVLLHFYLRLVFFKPLERTLQRRYEATEGARKVAEESLARAAAKTAEYEAALRAARAEVYQSQDRLHKQLQDEQLAQVAAARQRTEATVNDAKRQLAADVEQAKGSLAAQSDLLANQIAEAILRRSAA